MASTEDTKHARSLRNYGFHYTNVRLSNTHNRHQSQKGNTYCVFFIYFCNLLKEICTSKQRGVNPFCLCCWLLGEKHKKPGVCKEQIHCTRKSVKVDFNHRLHCMCRVTAGDCYSYIELSFSFYSKKHALPHAIGCDRDLQISKDTTQRFRDLSIISSCLQNIVCDGVFFFSAS